MSKWILRSVVSLLTLLLIVILAFRGAAFHRETVPFAAGLPDEGRLLETTEGSFFILETGSAENPRVLFAHGTAAWSAIWRETMYELSKADYFASAFDMPPFGWSEYPDGNDFDRSTQADRVIALLETLDDKPIIVAHSVGAGPVSEAVLRRPDLVTGFVIVAGAIGLSDRDNSKQPPLVLRNSVLREYLTAATVSNPLLTRKFLRDFMHRDDTATPEVVEVLQEPIVREGYTRAVSNWIPELFTTHYHAVSLKPTAWSALDLPVALIWGANDTVTPVSQGKELASLVPNSTLTTMKDVGHIPHLEAPADFSAELVFVLNRMTQPHKEERE